MNNKFYKIFALLIMLTLSAKISAQCPTLVYGAPVVNNATCNNTNPTGSITAKLTSGDPIKWELLNYSTLAVIQTFNSTAQTFTFTGVAAGQYKVRVTDGCGFVLTQDQIVGWYPSIASSNFNFFAGQTKEYVGACGSEKVRVFLSYGDNSTANAVVYPLTVTATVHMPDGTTQIITKTISSAATNNLTVDNTGQMQLNFIDLPLVEEANYSYDISITDGCGTTKTKTAYPLDTHHKAVGGSNIGPTPCGNAFPLRIFADNFFVGGTVTAKINTYNGSSTASPAGSTITLNQDFPTDLPRSSCCYQIYEVFHFSGSFGNQPIGNYNITVTDSCGRSYTFDYNHNPQVNYILGATAVAGCGAGSNDNVAINQTQNVLNGDGGYRYMRFQSVKITAAPAGSGLALPYDVSNYIIPSNNGILLPGSVFPVTGNYTFEVTNECGVVQSTSVAVGQYLPNYNVTVQNGCNVFSLNMNFSNIKSGLYFPAVNNVNQHQFLLQWYNPATGKWEHPTTGVSTPNPTDNNAQVTSSNGIVLQNGAMNGPWAKSGKYRIVDIYVVDNTVYPYISCMNVAKEFEVDFNISFTYNVIQCPDGSYSLLASASGGNGNFTFNLYNSTHTTLVQSNSTGVFTNLPTGNYMLDITDTCPNALLNQPISVPGTATPLAVKVTGDPCTIGSQVTLSVPKLGGVTYKWYKTSAPGTILSNTNEYNFTANPPATTTSYSVQITYTADPTNCVNQTLTYVVPSCVCYRDANKTNPGIDTKHGVTLLKRAGSTDPDNWPMLRKSGHTVLESNSKGFVVTRMTSDPAQSAAPNYIGKISVPVEGMMVYDTFSKCLKIYVDGAWKCFVNPACPD